MVTLKYVFVILNADNEGEGGTFSCYSLLTRYVRRKLSPKPCEGMLMDPRHASQTETREKK